MKFLPVAIVFLLSLEKDLSVRFVSAESVPTEAPTPEYSDYPVSSFPSVMYPETDKPFYEATCVETHKNVVDTLYDAFGRNNCVKNNPIEYVQTVKCEVFGTNQGGDGKQLSAEYMGAYGAPYAYSGNCLLDYVPSTLTLTSTYLDGSMSAQEMLFFSRKDCGDCLSNQDGFFRMIQQDRQRGPPKCKGDDVKLELKEKGNKTCAKIQEKGFCDRKVKEAVGDKKRASDFCTSCGCGGGYGDNVCCGDISDDDKCVDTKKKIQLNSGKIECKDLKKDLPNKKCNKKVPNDPCGKTVRDFCPESCHCSPNPGVLPVMVSCGAKQCQFEELCASI